MFKQIKIFLNTNIFFLILLVIIVFLLYGKSINFEPTGLDDTILIKDNINFISDFRNIPKLFTMSAFYDNSTLYYRPVLSLSFAIESFFVRDNFKIYHLTNIILFVLSLYLFYLFCIELELNQTILKFILLIIAVHPMFVSIAVWIPGRNDSLLALFFVTSFIFFIRYLNTKKTKYAFLFCFFFVVSMFTKETFISLIPLYFIYLCLYDFNVSKNKLLLLFVVLIPFVFTFFILRSYSVASLGYEYYISNIGKCGTNFIKDSLIYCYNFFIPENIPTILFNANLNFKIVFYNCLFIFILLFILYKKILSKRIFLFSCALIIFSMVPTFLQKEDIYLNHRFFVCSTGFIIIMACLVDSLILKFDKLKNIFKFILIAVFVFYFSYCFSFSYKQAEKYKDYKSFWINAYQDSPDYYIACQNLAGIYMDAGLLDEAQYYIEKTISLKSTFKTLINYANFLIVLGNFDEAETALLGIEKDMKGSKDLIYYPLSEIYYRKEDYGKAQQYALKAYNIKPYNIDYCKQLIKIYDIMGHYEEETKIYEQLLNFDKKNEEYKNKIRELKEKRNNKENTNA